MTDEVYGRDVSTLANISEAIDAIDRAMKTMPNHIRSVFDGDDAVRLHEVHRQLSILMMAESELPRSTA
jgi:hypothetical protein